MPQRIVLFLVLVTVSARGQVPTQTYFELVKQADSLYNIKAYEASAAKYSAAFSANGWKGTMNARYNAACSYALAGVPDSAFYHLSRIALLMNYTDYTHISTDPDLATLHADKRWAPLIETVRNNKDKAENVADKPLALTLDSIYVADQKYRKQLDAIAESYGWNSKEMSAIWGKIRANDSVNLIRVSAILDKYGWLGPADVGADGSSTLFLVIQHSNLETQQKYLPLMREAVKNGKANAGSLALLEDRVALGQGKRQIYGSQVARDEKTNKYYVLPLEDPDNVDKRRATVGLSKLSDYVSHWQIVWDPVQYKKELPELEKKRRKE